MKLRNKLILFLLGFTSIFFILLLGLWFFLLAKVQDNYSEDFRSEVLELGIEISDSYANNFFQKLDSLRSQYDDFKIEQVVSEINLGMGSAFFIKFNGKINNWGMAPDEMINLLSEQKLEEIIETARIAKSSKFILDNYDEFLLEGKRNVLPVRIHCEVLLKEKVVIVYGQALYSVLARVQNQEDRSRETRLFYSLAGLSFSFLSLLALLLAMVFFTRKVITRPVEKMINRISLYKQGDLIGQIAVSTGDEFEEIGETIDELNNETAELIGLVSKSEEQFRSLFENAEISILNLDLSRVIQKIEKLRKEGIKDFQKYLTDHPDSIVETVSLSKISMVNEATLRLFKAKSQDEFIADFVSRSFKPDFIKLIRDMLCALWEKQSVFSSETVLFDLYDTPVNVLISLIIPKNKNDFDVVPVTCVDLTERKQLEEQLSQAQKMEAIGTLSGGIAHDFNNMLSIIFGHTELILENMEPGTPIENNLSEIKKASERSINLVRQLLAFARKQTISPKVINLNEIMDKMLSMLKRLIGEDIDLAWVPKKDLWPVKIDPSQVDQILANLCVNSRDAIKGVGKVTIETDAVTLDEAYCRSHIGFRPGDYVVIIVSDNGCGIEKEVLGNIFDPFFTTKGVGEGSGLGLATTYGIARQNNGFINVYSEPKKGSTFKVYLPRYGKSETQHIEVFSKKEVPTGHETILLVEDEKAILDMTTIMLQRLGYTVLSASSPAKAIEAVSKSDQDNVDLLMTDVIMPEMNGKDLAYRLTGIYPELKCLFMSGYTANVIAHQGVLDEGVNFINKPFTKKRLAFKIREILDAEDTAL